MFRPSTVLTALSGGMLIQPRWQRLRWGITVSLMTFSALMVPVANASTNIIMRFEVAKGALHNVICRFNGAKYDVKSTPIIEHDLPGYQGFYLESIATDTRPATLERLLESMRCEWNIPYPRAQIRKKWKPPETYQATIALRALVPPAVIKDILSPRPAGQHKALKLLLYFNQDHLAIRWDTESWVSKPIKPDI